LPEVREVRGQGLLLGIVLKSENAIAVRDSLLVAGVLVNAPSASVIRIAPALTITTREIKKFLSVFTEVLKEDSHGAG
jgi:acetylornithine/N-succinyldiaminopimelate aminotransferase